MEQTGRYDNKSFLKEKRRNLRLRQTKAERILWKRIRGNQLMFKFRRQYSISRCIVDFYCHELRLIIEIDGSTHEDKWLGYDRRRQMFLENQGYRFIRYQDADIIYNIDGVISDLISKLQTWSR